MWHVTFGSTLGTCDSPEPAAEAVAGVETTAAPGAFDTPPSALGVFVAGATTAAEAEGCFPDAEAQPPSITVNVRQKVIGPEVCMSGMYSLGPRVFVRSRIIT